ncbi:conserved hypothetical protein [Paenibacillus curdlanolyticus YK9]|uniref:YlzJ-like protein n=1 Tax=Paenibacillus curdlanolyticus YK9 TaxID=717606 RepID=E0I4A7_9BACL|nr:YlzJ-like family protein [Paenibacillus curdlanolyticus]EFM13121.1 conserved hypothetical protein [Paenibacillus curdlanolyticus YK9]
MTIYTSMPLELVLAGMTDDRDPLVELELDGALLQIEPVAPGIGKVVRLIHAPLQQYLNPKYYPGSLIAYPASPS